MIFIQSAIVSNNFKSIKKIFGRKLFGNALAQHNRMRLLIISVLGYICLALYNYQNIDIKIHIRIFLYFKF